MTTDTCAVAFNDENGNAPGADCVSLSTSLDVNSAKILHKDLITIILDYFANQGLTPKLIMRGSRVIIIYDDAFKQHRSILLASSICAYPKHLQLSDLKFNTRQNLFSHIP